MRCGQCGHKEFNVQNVRDKFVMPWKDFPNVLLTEDFDMPVCIKCGNHIITGDAVMALNDAMRISLQKTTSALIRSICDKYEMTLRELSYLTGLTPQYVSMMLNLKKVPAYQLVKLLEIIYAHPEILAEMQRDWKKAEEKGVVSILA